MIKTVKRVHWKLFSLDIFFECRLIFAQIAKIKDFIIYFWHFRSTLETEFRKKEDN